MGCDVVPFATAGETPALRVAAAPVLRERTLVPAGPIDRRHRNVQHTQIDRHLAAVASTQWLSMIIRSTAARGISRITFFPWVKRHCPLAF